MISFISSLEIINGFEVDLNIFLWIAASVADGYPVNPNCFKTLLANGLSSCPNKCYPVFSNGPKSLPNNRPDCPILCNSVFHNFLLADELFSKALRSLESCVFCSNSLCRKLLWWLESPRTFHKLRIRQFYV